MRRWWRSLDEPTRIIYAWCLVMLVVFLPLMVITG